jgi:glycosyltransferase involved in cell wall biosynthesis
VNACIYVDWFWPAYKAGGPVQSLANLVAQGGEGISYSVICSNKDLDLTEVDATPDQWTGHNPWTRVWYSSKGVGNELLRTKADVAFINGLYSWQYNLKPVLFSGARRKIVSARGMLHPGALSQKRLKKKLYLGIWKVFGLHKRVEFHASTEEEKGCIQAVFGRSVKVHVAANFPRAFQKQPMPEKQPGTLKLLSIALISPMKNILLVLQALEYTKSMIDYHIYGPVKDEVYWQQCKEAANSLPANVQVIYHGDLHPDCVEEALQKAHVFILPSRSENFGHALYEALAAGRPVITSRATPWNNLQAAKAGQNISLADAQGLTAAIETFAAMTGTELEAWSDGAKAYANAALNRDKISEQYRNMFGVSDKKEQPIHPTEKAI